MDTNLSTRAMLVSLNISVWTARRYDKRVSEDVAKQHGTRREMGRYHKRLIADADSYARIKKLSQEVRDFHYTYTLPWANEGARILPAQAYMTYAPKLREYHQAFTQAVTDFSVEYPTLKSEAKVLLQDLYDEADYPDDVTDRFDFKLSIFPLPDTGDFRIALTDGEVDYLKSQLEDNLTTTFTQANKEVWQRLYAAVHCAVERLSDPDAVFRDSLVSNLVDVCKVLPLLNVTSDVDLEAMRVKVEQDLTACSPQMLRDNERLRAGIAEKAASIQKAMSAYMGVQ